ncbi:MAG: DUF4198 domain-containing protein [Rhizobacter sp.]|nr:DUF4198 domain-containing protein [Rhizobacter sp.]
MHPIPHRFPKTALAWLLCAMAGSASAHDTWFERLPSAKPGELRLALGTGNRFPVHEFGVGAASLRASGCRANTLNASVGPLKTVRETPTALIVRAQSATTAAVTCWAQQQPFEVEIAPPIVETYFKEINAPQALRTAWAEMRARGITWKERYSKHARIELPGQRGGSAQPTGMAMDVLLQSGLQAVRVGDALVFQVLRDGEPLPGLAVELHSNQSPIGFWKQTDAQGRVSFAPPLAGRWVLRGTDLRLSTTEPDTWESRFVTLAFEVASP